MATERPRSIARAQSQTSDRSRVDNPPADGGNGSLPVSRLSVDHPGFPRFLDLPAEVRMIIYRFTFLKSTMTHRIKVYKRRREETLKVKLLYATSHRNILLTSTSCWWEAIRTYYEYTRVTLLGGKWKRDRVDLHLPKILTRNLRHLYLPSHVPDWRVIDIMQGFTIRLRTVHCCEVILYGRRDATNADESDEQIFWSTFKGHDYTCGFPAIAMVPVDITCPVNYNLRTYPKEAGDYVFTQYKMEVSCTRKKILSCNPPFVR